VEETKMHIRTTAAALLLVLGAWGTSGAQTGGGYDLTWSSLDCGSPVLSTGGSYTLAGTIGQPDVGGAAGGAYALNGGFRRAPTDAPPPDVEQGTGPLVFRLQGSSPNPFAKTTAISFSLKNEEQVEMRIYDLAGRVVRTVLDARLGGGHHQVVWDGRDDSGRHVAHGIYMLRLRAGDFQARRKLALVP
jgi:hypothetical protein